MKTNKRRKHVMLIFALGTFAAIATSLLLNSSADAPNYVFQAGTHVNQLGTINNCIDDSSGASGDTLTIFGASCPTGSTVGSNTSVNDAPSRFDAVPCTTDRTILAANELPLTTDLKLQSLLEPATEQERQIINDKIADVQDFPMRDLMSVEDGGAPNGGSVEIRKLPDGSFVRESHLGDLPWEGFANDIVGKVGLTSTFFEGRGVHQFNIKAFESHRASVDPIVFPCQESAGHEHTFFGNATVSGSSTTSSMFGTATTANPIGQIGNEYIGDYSAYWIPSLIVGDTRPPMIQNSIYYSNSGGNYFTVDGEKDFTRPPAEPVQAFPMGLRMVAGNANATSASNISSNTYWTVACPGESLVTIKRGTNLSAVGGQSLTGCTVRMFIRFPSWWDGVHLAKPDNSHMSYTKTATHTTPLPAVQYVLPYKINSNHTISDMSLSSGSLWSLHGDFWNVWDPTMLDFLVERTINRGENWQEWRAVTTETAFVKNDIQGRNELDLGAVPEVLQCSPPLATNRATFNYDVPSSGQFNAWFRVRRQGGLVDPNTTLMQIDGIRVNDSSNCAITASSDTPIGSDWVWIKADQMLDYSIVGGPHELHLSSNVGRLELDQFLLTSTACDPGLDECDGTNDGTPTDDPDPDPDDGHDHGDHDPDRANIVPYGQFESDGAAVQTVWLACSTGTPGCTRGDFPAGVTFGVNDAVGIDGSRALEIRADGRPSDEKNFWTTKNGQSPTAEPNKEYQGSVSVMVENTDALPEFKIVFLDAQNNILSSATSNPGTAVQGWQTLNVNAVAPENTAKLRVDLTMTGSGVAWFDDVFAGLPSVDGGDDTTIDVCRDGMVVAIFEDDRLPTDTDPPCIDDGTDVTEPTLVSSHDTQGGAVMSKTETLGVVLPPGSEGTVAEVRFEYASGELISAIQQSPFGIDWNPRTMTRKNANFSVRAIVEYTDSSTFTTDTQTFVVRTPDIVRDDSVNITDLATLLRVWGQQDIESDLNNNGSVGIVDLSILLSSWGD